MPEATVKTPKGAKKLKVIPRNRSYYKMQFLTTEDNKKKKLGRHIRHHPTDSQAITAYEVNKGPATGHVTNATSQAKRKLALKAKARAKAKQLAARWAQWDKSNPPRDPVTSPPAITWTDEQKNAAARDSLSDTPLAHE